MDVLQSEEGGRFLMNENRYQIIRLNDEEDFFISDNQRWITALELKSLLLSSNLVSIQLRSISSLIVNTLNPLLMSP